MFTLYKNKKLLLSAPYLEDLISLVEILKQYNKPFINRKEFIIKCNNKIIYSWKRK